MGVTNAPGAGRPEWLWNGAVAQKGLLEHLLSIWALPVLWAQQISGICPSWHSFKPGSWSSWSAAILPTSAVLWSCILVLFSLHSRPFPSYSSFWHKWAEIKPSGCSKTHPQFKHSNSVLWQEQISSFQQYPSDSKSSALVSKCLLTVHVKHWAGTNTLLVQIYWRVFTREPCFSRLSAWSGIAHSSASGKTALMQCHSLINPAGMRSMLMLDPDQTCSEWWAETAQTALVDTA